tara:strand:+ start:2056 stop:3321 length:1266 start_codon:yes stop_codon:yes gene_type:complete
MIVGVIGSGGREHAICELLNRSKKIKKLYCFPGNAGTAKIAINVGIDTNDFESFKDYVLKNKIGLVVVGPEKPLVDGLVDYLEKFKIKVFGPNKLASKLEGSKIFTKKICEKYNIPSAKFGVFKNINEANNFLKKSNHPIVIKADNLASGKGVYICENLNESYNAVKEIFNGKFGKANNVLIEEFLKGEEMSFFVISDGTSIKNFDTAQDHKRVLEGDKGKNTGGMGAYSPSRLIEKQLEKKILNKIINPTLKALKDLGTEYKGFLYAGLMIIDNEPYLIEYNVRMGDPECQTILPKLKTDICEIFLACCNKKLKETEIQWSDKKSLCVVLCSKGYPENYKKEVEIENLNKIDLNNEDYLFHAGTLEREGKIFSIGGRVLNFVSLSNEFINAREKINNYLNKLNWTGGFYRKDIGYKVIDK